MRQTFFVYTLLGFFFLCGQALAAKPFVVVLDPGHGGKDFGAVRNGVKEKDINLEVSLQVGKLLETHCAEVQVVYTRKTDVFVPLHTRAKIAHRAKADLFISIHVNAVAKATTVHGAETFVLGLSRSEDNLAVAKKENAVILLEENYEQTYQGFDPNSVESYIIFELVQNKFLDQSISFASLLQKEFTGYARRMDRGVKQAGFLVLREVSVPSVLIELGFLSNPDERAFMTSASGQNKLSQAIYQAFSGFKAEHDRRMQAVQKKETSPDKTETTTDELIYKVQFLVSPSKLSPRSSKLKSYPEAEYYQEQGLYKYTLGASTNQDEIINLQKQVRKDFKDAFVVVFQNGKRIK